MPRAIKLSDRERDVMLHALGIDSRHKKSYRNYFAASPRDADDFLWRRLVRRGLAKLIRTPDDIFDYNTYRVTDKGKLAVGIHHGR